MMKIYNSFTLYALKMLVFFRAAVKTPDISGSFNYVGSPYFAQRQQGSVDSIE
jgi:hypothetical protein